LGVGQTEAGNFFHGRIETLLLLKCPNIPHLNCSFDIHRNQLRGSL